MIRRNLCFATALAAVLLLPALAAAAPRGGFDPAAVLHNPRALARYLRLTPAQVEQQKALLAALKAEVEPLREQQKPLQESLREALQAGSPVACEVGALLVDIDALGDQVRAAHEEFDVAFSAILTAEQLARYEALKELARPHGPPPG